MHKIGQSGVFLGRCLESILKTGFLLMKNLLKPLAKSVLVSLGTIILIISNEEMNDIMKLVKSLEESGLLIKGFS